MMMSFCKKSVHSFLSFSNSSKDNGTVPLDSTSPTAAVASQHSRNVIPPPSPAAAGLNFFTLSENKQKPTNVVASSALKSPPSSSPPTIETSISIATSTDAAAIPSATQNKRDPGGIGFLDDVGGTVDGLMSCTESLGFESSDERRVDDDIITGMENIINQLGNKEGGNSRKESITKTKMVRKLEMRREKKSFPPPLSSLNQNGKPNFILQPVRRDGRLELTEVKIHRPEILRASRFDGRLRLNFICEEPELEEEEDEEEEEEEEIEKEIVGVKDGREGDGWRLPAAPMISGGGGGDGLRRCHELAGSRYRGQQHHDNLNVWRSNCVTIR